MKLYKGELMNQNEQLDLEIAEKIRELKKMLKSLSKNQLIAQVIQQLAVASEQQNLNKFLVEENKKLKEQLKECNEK